MTIPLDKSSKLTYNHGNGSRILTQEARETRIDIRTLREKAKITQKELAAQMGYGQTCVTNWETGVSLPRTADLPRLAAVLGVTVDELLREPETEGKE